MACARCGLPYPSDLLNPVVGDVLIKDPVCGICALAMVNDAHGTKMKRFHGEIAEDLRERAINWRRKHPNARATTR